MFINVYGRDADDVFIGKIAGVGNVNMGKGFQVVYIVDVDTLYRGRKSRRKYVREAYSSRPAFSSPYPLDKRYVFCVKRDTYGLYMKDMCNYPAEFPKLVNAASLELIGKGTPVSPQWPAESPPTLTFRLLSKPGLWSLAGLTASSVLVVFRLAKRSRSKK
ncbi:hypothetical protein EON80_14145 [bacterium]|nr:MAG: hypothetical protein EON80_14145 [bacterium]